MFEGDSAAAFARVRDAARLDLYGCDCYAYGLLAAGFVDLVSCKSAVAHEKLAWQLAWRRAVLCTHHEAHHVLQCGIPSWQGNTTTSRGSV